MASTRATGSPSAKKPVKRSATTPGASAAKNKGSARSTPLDARLLAAAAHGDLAEVASLVDLGADVRALDGRTGATALHAAAAMGHLPVVELLLQRGADLEAVTKSSNTTALGAAIMAGQLKTVRELLRASARHDLPFERLGWHCLHAAASTGLPELVDELLKAGADVHARTRAGQTTLAQVVQQGADPAAARETGEIILLLRRAGADPQAEVYEGESVLDIAEALGRDHLKPFLVQALPK